MLASFVVWAGFSTCPIAAHATPKTFVALEYEVVAGLNDCPSIEEFQASVIRQLGYNPFRSTAGRRVAVQIERKGAALEGWIRWTDTRGRWVGDRRLSSQQPACDEIGANVAFAVAVQLQLLTSLEPADAQASAHSSATGPAAGTSAEAQQRGARSDAAMEGSSILATGADAPFDAPHSQPSQAARLRLAGGLGPSLTLGMAPNAMGIGRIFVSGEIDPFSLELAVDAALPATDRAADGSGFSLSRVAASTAACGHMRPFAACLTATLGRLEARGVGVDRPATAAGLFSQLGGRISAKHTFSDTYFVGARIEAQVMLSSWEVALNDTIAWRTPRVSGLIGLDCGIIFF